MADKAIPRNEREENILCLNWNTILFQSHGFIKIMQKFGISDQRIDQLSPFKLKVFLLQYRYRHTSSIFDKTMSELDFYNFIKTNFAKISNESPTTYLLSLANIVCNQKFVTSFHIASIDKCNIPTIDNTRTISTFFDIFDVSQIEAYINENNINSLFVHDIRIVHDIVFNLNIKLTGFTFFVSKLGYNFNTDEVGNIVTKCESLLAVKTSLKFEIVYIDVYQLTQDDIQDNKNEER